MYVMQACGLEMLYHQAKARGCDGSPIRAEDDPNWLPFLQRLKDCNYFSSELEGSLKHQEKMSTAKEYFLSQRGHKREGEGEEGKKEWLQDNE